MKVTTMFSIFAITTSAVIGQEKNNWKLFPAKNDSSTKDQKILNIDSISNIGKPAIKDSKRVGYLEIVQEEKIKFLLEKQNRINESKMSISGFRIQLFSGSGAGVQSEANKMKSDFLKIYDDKPVYVDFDKPIWKTRVGDYRTKLEAEKFLLQIQEAFPNSFVVKDEINFPKN